MSKARSTHHKIFLGGISLLALAGAAPALAQTTPAPAGATADSTVVVVTGIRASLQSASSLKKHAAVIADSIVSEDIGKFPDTNIAESLSRVTGVQISRDIGGEGRFVSIRGLGSTFNLTTMNNRVLATDNAGRDFSFDIVPSEEIAAATVYKTAMASLPEGSIGGQIELKTYDPLARKGFHAAANLGGYYDNATKETTPHFSGIISDTFDSGKLGAFIGVTYYKRDWRSDVFEELSTSTEDVNAQGQGDLAEQPNFTGNIGRAAFPGISSFQVKYGTRERTGVVGGVNYRPNDRWEFRLDSFFSDYKDDDLSYSYNQNFYTNNGWGTFTNGTTVAYPGLGTNKYLLTSFDVPDIPLEEGTDTHHRETKTYMVGGHAVWRPSEKLRLDFDLAVSGSNKPDAGLDAYTVVGIANTGGSYHYQVTDTVPNVVCKTASGSLCIDTPYSDLGLHFMEQKGESDKDDVKSGKIDLTYDLNTPVPSKLLWGVFYSDREKDKKLYDSPNGCAYCGFTQTFGAIGTPVGVTFPKGGYQAADLGNGTNTWPAVTADQVFAAAIAANGQASFDANIKAAFLPRASSNIQEKIYGAYGQINWEGEHLSGNAGLRWVQTDDVSSGATQPLLAITPIANSTNFTGTFGDVSPVSVKNSYHDLLPSLNATYRFSPDLQLRFAVSKTITRPSFTQLGPDISWEINSPPPRATQNGNPRLKPIKSNNVDLSLEWYGSRGNAFSAAYFGKNIHDFITSGSYTEQVLGYTVQITSPVNGDSAKINGGEIAYQQLYDNGLGYQLNYTYVDNVAYTTVNGVTVKTGLDGVSRNTYNITGLYEKGPWSARLSYSYRGGYVDCASCGPTGGGNPAGPTSVEKAGFLDFSGSYQINPTYTVYLDGTNLTGESLHRYAGDLRYTEYYEKYATRYEFGVRAKW